MATVAQGQSQLVNLGPNDAIKVSTPGEAYVDHLSGTPESPYASTRLIKNTEPKVFGPYGVNAQLRVRAIELSALYDGYTDPQPALVNTDPTTGNTVLVGPGGALIPIGGKNQKQITVVGGGDSFIEFTFAAAGALPRGISSRGPLAWAQALSKGRINIIGLFGTAGDTTGEFIARNLANIIASPADIAVFELGINDLNSAKSVTLDTTKSNFIKIWSDAHESGKRVIQRLLAPLNASGSWANWAARYPSSVFELNEFILDFEKNNLSWFAASKTFDNVLDPASTTYGISARNAPDGLHRNALGARLDGIAHLAAMEQFLADAPKRVTSNAYSVFVNPAIKQLLRNPMLTGVAGTKTPRAGTIVGSVPDLWTVDVSTGNAAVVLSQEFDYDGKPHLRIKVSAAAASVVWLESEDLKSYIAVGEQVSTSVALRQITNIGCNFDWQFRRLIGGFDGSPSSAMLPVSPDYPSETLDIVLQTPPSALYAGVIDRASARLVININAGGDCEYVLKQAEFNKI